MTTACVPMRIFHLGDNRVNCVRRDDIFNFVLLQKQQARSKSGSTFLFRFVLPVHILNREISGS